MREYVADFRSLGIHLAGMEKQRDALNIKGKEAYKSAEALRNRAEATVCEYKIVKELIADRSLGAHNKNLKRYTHALGKKGIVASHVVHGKLWKLVETIAAKAQEESGKGGAKKEGGADELPTV